MTTIINVPTVFSQYDERWAKLLLGYNTDPKFNFYNFACLICTITLSCKYFGKDVSPIDINEKLKEKKGYAPGTGNYIWGSINKIFSDIKETKVETPNLLTDAQMGEIKSAIDSGYPVGIQLDYNPKTVEDDMHFVAIVGYDPNDENNFTIADPLGGKIRSLKDYLGWFRPSARKTINRYIIWTGPKPKVTSDTVVLSKDDAARRTHGNEQWIKIIGYLGLVTDPFLTIFEDAQKVVAGFKSRVTDLEKQLADKQTELVKANQEVDNQKDKLANAEKDCQTQLKLKDAEIKALSDTSKDVEKMRGEFMATIDELRGNLREEQKNGGLKDLEIADLKNQVEILKKPVATTPPTATTNWMNDLINSILDKLFSKN